MKTQLFILGSLVLLTTTASAQTWTTVTPVGTATPADMSVHNGAIYATIGVAGPHKSTDGTTWEAKADGFDTWGLMGAGISSTGEHLYYGSKNGLYRSGDNGETWTSVNAGLPDGGMVTSKSAAETYKFESTYFCIYQAPVFQDGGIYRSTDGENWTVSNTGLPTNVTIYQLVKIGGNLYACSNLDLFESTDDGLNWNSVSTNGAKVYNGLFEHPNGRRLIHTTFGIEYSDDDGTTWDSLTNSMTSSTICGFIQGEDDTIYAYSASTGIFYSVDAGDNWTDITDNLTSNDVQYMSDALKFGGNIYISTLLAIKANGTGGVPIDTNDTNGGGGPSVIHETMNQLNIETYPIPFNNQLTLRQREHEPMRIEMLNIAGELVVTAQSFGSILSIDTGLLPSGIYVINISSAETGELRQSRKVIKQ